MFKKFEKVVARFLRSREPSAMRETGEFKVDILPLSYTINQTNGIRINNNVDIKLLDTNEILNVSTVP